MFSTFLPLYLVPQTIFNDPAALRVALQGFSCPPARVDRVSALIEEGTLPSASAVKKASAPAGSLCAWVEALAAPTMARRANYQRRRGLGAGGGSLGGSGDGLGGSIEGHNLEVSVSGPPKPTAAAAVTATMATAATTTAAANRRASKVLVVKAAGSAAMPPAGTINNMGLTVEECLDMFD